MNYLIYAYAPDLEEEIRYKMLNYSKDDNYVFAYVCRFDAAEGKNAEIESAYDIDLRSEKCEKVITIHEYFNAV